MSIAFFELTWEG